MTDRGFTFLHAPDVRSSRVLRLVAELRVLQVPHPLDFAAGERRASAPLAVNPTGKVAAIRQAATG